MEKITLHTFEISDLEKAIDIVFKKYFKDFSNHPEKETLVLLTREEAAKILCVSLPTLHQWTKDGIIPAYRIGGRVLYKLDDLKAALNRVKTLKFRRD